jgi:hypothetical protein
MTGQQQQQTKLAKGLSKIAPMPLKSKASSMPGMDSKAYNNPAYNKKYGDNPAKPSKPMSKVKSAVKTMKSRLPTYAQVQKSVQKAKGY